MQELAAGLGTVKGKKTYGYLPKQLKGLVDEIVDQMERRLGWGLSTLNAMPAGMLIVQV